LLAFGACGGNEECTDAARKKGRMSEVAFRVAKEWDVVRVRVSDEGTRRVAKLLADGRCVACEEPIEAGEQVKCGQCATCYQAARRAIKAKKVSRSQLIRDGKMLAPRDGGRKPSNKFTRELSES
jgi:hypothetical protein